MTASRIYDFIGIGVKMEHLRQDLTGSNGDTAGLSAIHESLTDVLLHDENIAGASTSRAGELNPLEQRISSPEVQSCRICLEEHNTADDPLVELNCKCQGELSRAHRICILKWFGVRVFLRRKSICEICTKSLVNITQMVYSAMADHEGSRDILYEAIGAAMEHRTAIQGESRPIVQETEEMALQTISPVAQSAVQNVQDLQPDPLPGPDSRRCTYRNIEVACGYVCFTAGSFLVVLMLWVSYSFYRNA